MELQPPTHSRKLEEPGSSGSGDSSKSANKPDDPTFKCTPSMTTIVEEVSSDDASTQARPRDSHTGRSDSGRELKPAPTPSKSSARRMIKVRVYSYTHNPGKYYVVDMYE